MRIYADNAATTPMSQKALETMTYYMKEVYGNPSSLHSVGQKAADALLDARETMASLLGCQPAEITFTSGGTESDNQAIISAALWGERKGKKHIISAAFEHHAVLHTLKKLEKQGFEITLLPIDENGILRTAQIADALRPDTALVTIMYANNEIGTIQPVAEIGALCKEKGVLFHTDAVQAAGQLHIDVKKQNLDLLSLSAHKFHGPKGAGLLYARKGIGLTNIIEGGAQERGKRSGTENLPAIVAMAAAFEESCENIAENAVKVSALRDKLIHGLSAIPHAILNGDPVSRLPGNVNFSFEGIEGEQLLAALDKEGICASSGSACAAGGLDPSHVLLAMGRPRALAYSALRLSLSSENTEAEIDYMCTVIPQVVTELRSASPVWQDLMAGKGEFVLK